MGHDELPILRNVNADNAKFCSSCGRALAGGATVFSAPQPVVDPYAPKVPDYLIPAIIELICCCMPLGIVSLYYAIQAREKKAVGNYAAALTAAQTAKTFFWIGLVAGFVFIVIYIIGMVMGVIDSSKFGH